MRPSYRQITALAEQTIAEKMAEHGQGNATALHEARGVLNFWASLTCQPITAPGFDFPVWAADELRMSALLCPEALEA